VVAVAGEVLGLRLIHKPDGHSLKIGTLGPGASIRMRVEDAIAAAAR